jgi:uncharacterized protein YbaR (Trm112 family)
VTIAPDLLEILRCPACRGTLVLVAVPPALDCTACGRRYPIRDEIPILLVDEATRPA